MASYFFHGKFLFFSLLSDRDGGSFFFFNDTATTEIYTLSLHDALPISGPFLRRRWAQGRRRRCRWGSRSEEHTSELQSLRHLVCRLLLEKKKKSSISNVTRISTSHRSRRQVQHAPSPG